MASDAVGLDRLSRVLGYVIKRGNFATSSPNLPKVIVVLGEANHANQSGLNADIPVEVTSAKQAGDLFGYGSPIHIVMRILRPFSGEGVGGIKTIVIPQAEAGGSAAKVFTISPAGVATKGGTHYVKIAGRNSIDGISYAINIVQGDTVATIVTKIDNAVNAVLASPMSATGTPYASTLTAKWNGLTSQDLTVSIDVGNDSLGLTYVVNQTVAGSGTPSVANALLAFGNNWYTDVMNTYGTVSTIMSALESFNGNPNPTNPTGRYGGIVFKPFVAYTGSVADDPSATTDARKLELTIALCVAPNSLGLPMEAAANACVIYAPISQSNPHLDANGQYYPDMPTPTSIGSMADYNNRDAFVKKGCSTVDLVAGKYQIQDFVTTYHPDGEIPAQFRYVRNLNLDWNVRYGYFLKEIEAVLDHVLAGDEDTVSASNVIKPKQWKGILDSYADDLVARALISDAAFMQDSIQVNISTTNPDRFETSFKYKRTGVARISATTAEAGFNFGSSN